MSTTDERLAGVFARALGLSPIDDTTSMSTADVWDSVGHMNVVLELESEFGISITVDESLDITSVPFIKTMLATKNLG